jgi:hypothetical protein
MNAKNSAVSGLIPWVISTLVGARRLAGPSGPPFGHVSVDRARYAIRSFAGCAESESPRALGGVPRGARGLRLRLGDLAGGQHLGILAGITDLTTC